MATERIDTLVLEEFRLAAVDTDGAVARIVGATPSGPAPAMPLLTSIDDPHDVATVLASGDGPLARADEARRTALDPFVSSWQTTKLYDPHLVAQSQSPPRYYRLAVTESGINDADTDRPVPHLSGDAQGDAQKGASAPFDLLWIGRPRATHAGLLILLGSAGPDPRTSAPHEWPLPMSRELGVRIYEGRA